jgi:uncharacterized LabA/DUF88 family protein
MFFAPELFQTAMILSPTEGLSRPPKYRVITYIDGFNLYFGIRNQAVRMGSSGAPDPKWYRYLWLDLVKMSRRMLTERQELSVVKYFTSPITGNKGKQDRQNAFLDALRTLADLEITFGRFQPDRKECDRCGHPAFHPQEKKTDVNIAVNLLCDAIENKFDTAILVTGDSDLVPAVDAVKRLRPDKRIVVAFPPTRYSKELQDATKMPPIKIWEPLLRASRFPERIQRQGLPDVLCPEKYSGKPGCTSAKADAPPSH